MSTSIQRHIGSEQSPCPNLDFTSIDDGSVEVEEDVITQFYVGTVIDVNGRFDPGFFGEEFFVRFFGFCWWRKRCFVVDDAGIVSFRMLDNLCRYSILTLSTSQLDVCES